jgi:hypothetical protein
LSKINAFFTSAVSADEIHHHYAKVMAALDPMQKKYRILSPPNENKCDRDCSSKELTLTFIWKFCP